jgi:hypothetical protein
MAYGWYGPMDGCSVRPEIKPLEAPDQEAMAIDSLTLEQYHEICFWDLSQLRTFDCSTCTTVNLNTIIACPLENQLRGLVEIAHLPDARLFLDSWRTVEGVTGEVMEDGWTRYFILAAW